MSMLVVSDIYFLTTMQIRELLHLSSHILLITIPYMFYMQSTQMAAWSLFDIKYVQINRQCSYLQMSYVLIRFWLKCMLLSKNIIEVVVIVKWTRIRCIWDVVVLNGVCDSHHILQYPMKETIILCHFFNLSSSFWDNNFFCNISRILFFQNTFKKFLGVCSEMDSAVNCCLKKEVSIHHKL